MVVRFSPNGRMLATASEDNTACLWAIPDLVLNDAESIRMFVESRTQQTIENGFIQVLEIEAWRQQIKELESLNSDSLIRR